jgi:hypothetical protein
MSSKNGLWGAIVVANERTENGNGKLDQLYELIQNLPEESKAELIKRLQASTQSTPQFGTNHITGPLVIQVSMMDKESMSALLHAIADKMGGVP